MLKKVTALILCALLAFCLVGCNNVEPDQNYESQPTQETASNTESNIDSSAPETQEDNGIVLDKTPKVSEKQAVDIAFAELKENEDEYNLEITDEGKEKYTCKIEEREGEYCYNINFNGFLHKGASNTHIPKVNVWVNVDTGEILAVAICK